MLKPHTVKLAAEDGEGRLCVEASHSEASLKSKMKVFVSQGLTPV